MNHLPVETSSLELYLKEIQKFPLLSREEEYNLAVEWHKSKDYAAAHSLITSNLRFVVRIANEYRNYGLKLADLIQEGNVGLMKAVKKFDPSRGYRLISYAVWWIKAHIHNFILNSWSLVKLGTTQAQRKLFYQLNSLKNLMALRDGETLEEHIGELSARLCVTENDVREMNMRISYRDFSLDCKMDESLQHTFVESIAADEQSQEDQIIDQEQNHLLRKEVIKISNELNDKERFILHNRLMAEKPMTLQEIGAKFGITRERIRQIESGTKEKIRSFLEKSNLIPMAAY